MKQIIITLKPYKSPYYPIQARFTINGVKYSTVHEDEATARRYYEGKYTNVIFR